MPKEVVTEMLANMRLSQETSLLNQVYQIQAMGVMVVHTETFKVTMYDELLKAALIYRPAEEGGKDVGKDLANSGEVQ